MSTEVKGFLERKTQLVIKDLDTAGLSYSRHFSQIVSIRTWNVTLLVAYLGLSATTGRLGNWVIILPAVLIPTATLILDMVIQPLYAAPYHALTYQETADVTRVPHSRHNLCHSDF